MLQVYNRDDDQEYDVGEAEFLFLQKRLGQCLPDEWILLDSYSTVDIFKTKQYFHNIREERDPLVLNTNGDDHRAKFLGMAPRFGRV